MEEETKLESDPNSRESASSSLKYGYFEPPHADVIVQSSDLVNFRVNKVVLSVSSPFFADMFSLPQPSDSELIDGLPVIRLSEDAEILNSLLTMLYPVLPAVPNSYDKALELLATCQKYDMAGVQSSVRTEIKSRGPIVSTGTMAYRAYAISSNANLLPEMETSSRHTLDFPMTFDYLSDELTLFGDRALGNLIGYRKRCRDGLVSTLQSFLDSNVAPSNIWVVCMSGVQTPQFRNQRLGNWQLRAVFAKWLQDMFSEHIQRLQGSFTDPLRMPSNIRGAYLDALNTHLNLTSCLPCAKVHACNGELFCKELESKLSQALDKVSALWNSWTLSHYGNMIDPGMRKLTVIRTGFTH